MFGKLGGLLSEVLVRAFPDVEHKVAWLMSLAADDHDTGSGSAALPARLRNASRAGTLRPLNLRSVRFGRQGRAALLRILMTNACAYNCHYCPMRRDRALPRTLLKPGELVRVFLGALERGWCSGLFITTGIPSRPVRVMDDVIEVLERLRIRHRFRGYIHVKLVPGADPAQIERVTRLASRVSINLEVPCGENLQRVAPDKRLDTALGDLRQAAKLVTHARQAREHGRPTDPLAPAGAAGITTQFVVGATPDSDRTLIRTVAGLYAGGGVHHAHFSAFRPIRDTPLEHAPAAPAVREQRLYQADHLMRDYGFASDELVYDERGNLPLARDPKLTWALTHPERFPVEIRSAPVDELIRVPGIGPVVAARLVEHRRSTVIRGLADLRRLGVLVDRAAGFLTVGGRRLSSHRWAEQLGFWAPDAGVGAPHLIYEVSPGTFR